MTPDWTFDLGTPPWRPSPEQQALLDELEVAIQCASHGTALVTVAPLIRQLAATGMTAQQIADHSRVHPRGVAAVLG